MKTEIKGQKKTKVALQTALTPLQCMPVDYTFQFPLDTVLVQRFLSYYSRLTGRFPSAFGRTKSGLQSLSVCFFAE